MTEIATFEKWLAAEMEGRPLWQGAGYTTFERFLVAERGIDRAQTRRYAAWKVERGIPKKAPKRKPKKTQYPDDPPPREGIELVDALWKKKS